MAHADRCARRQHIRERPRRYGSTPNLLPRRTPPLGILRQADCSRLRDPFQPCGDINPVAHEVAVVLIDNVAKMDADAAASLRVFDQATSETRIATNLRVSLIGARNLPPPPVAGSFAGTSPSPR